MKQILNKVLDRFGYAPKGKTGKRHFHGAAINRLTFDWVNQNTSLDSVLRLDLPRLRARSRDLAINSPYIQKFLSMLKNNVLGSAGLRLKNKAKELDQYNAQTGQIIPGKMDVLANKKIEDAWKEWGKRENCTLDQTLSFRELESLALETIGTDGEVLIRMIPGAPNKFRFALQPIDTDRLDVELNEQRPNRNQIRMGVERAPNGRRVAYWLLRENPSDYLFNYGVTQYRKEYDVVPAEEVIHPFLMRRIGQTRGFPWPAYVMLNIKMLAGYEEAELVASRTAASKMAFFKREGESNYQGPEDGTGNKVMEAEPGLIEELPQGLDLQVLDWKHPNSNFDGFVKAVLRSMAAGLGVSYNSLANDLEGVNFSSGRMGQMEERENWKFIQSWMANSFHDPVFAMWLPSAITSGQITLPLQGLDKFKAPSWTGRRWAWVDPTKEVSARIQELNAGLTSLTKVAMELGMTKDELLSEIREDQEDIKALGLVLPELWQSASAPPSSQPTNPVDEPEEPEGDEDEDEAEDGATGNGGSKPKVAQKAQDFTALKAKVDAYGVAVRAGVLTPNPGDENQFREQLGLPPAPPEVGKAWNKDGNIRRPITLVQPGDASNTGGAGKPESEDEEETED